MPHPAVYIVTGVVIAAAAVMAVFSYYDWYQKSHKTSHGRRGPNNSGRYSPPSPLPTPPSTPPTRRRRRSPERRSNTAASATSSANVQHRRCKNCGESPYIRISPCNHESLCKGCFENHLKNNDTCPDCHGRIDSISPAIPPYEKCRECRKFTKLFKFLDCNHSLCICIRCFEEGNKSYKVCPECKKRIRGSEPPYTTSGTCGVCEEFTRLATFRPCGHSNFCKQHALSYLERNDQECSCCPMRVEEVV